MSDTNDKLDVWRNFGEAVQVSHIAGDTNAAEDVIRRNSHLIDEGERVQREFKQKADERERQRREEAEASNRAFREAQAKARAERKHVTIDASVLASIRADLQEIEQHQQRVATLVSSINDRLAKAVQ